MAEAGFRLFTLTNNLPELQTRQLEHAGLVGFFQRRFSADSVKHRQPSRQAYAEVERNLGVEPSQLCLIACHTWDTLGAVPSCWEAALIERVGNDLLGVGPQAQIVGADLDDVADRFIARQRSEPMTRDTVSVVLVHGAWADGSSWAKVIGPLAARGIKVLAAPLPLTSFADDAAALERALERVVGPVVVAAHAYAGAVSAATRNEKVKALVYIAALAPDEGETVADVFYRTEPHPLAPKLAPDNHGLIYLPEEAFAAALAQNAAADELALLFRGSAAQFARVHHNADDSSALERPPNLVSHGGTGPHDRLRDAALYGGTDAGSGAVAPCRPRTHSYCASPDRRHHQRGNRGNERQLIDTIHDRMPVIGDERAPDWW